MAVPLRSPDADLLAAIPAEVLEHDCGCGSAWRSAREGETAVDLGCGSGKTCFLLSKAVGASGKVIGIDASPAFVAMARRHQAAVAQAIGWSNVRFEQARIQDGGLPGAHADLAVLDCVWTFVRAPERAEILAAAVRALRGGGRLLVSDVLAEGLEGLAEALEHAGFGKIEVIERDGRPHRVVDGVPRYATTLRAYALPAARSSRSMDANARGPSW